MQAVPRPRASGPPIVTSLPQMLPFEHCARGQSALDSQAYHLVLIVRVNAPAGPEHFEVILGDGSACRDSHILRDTTPA